MNSILAFIAVCSTIVLMAWIVSKITGAHAWYIESWTFNDGEIVVWRDDAADVGLIPKLGQAVVMRPMRYHRWPVVVTNQRIIIGNKTFRGRQMVKYVLYAGASPDDQSKRAGGLFLRGYSTLVIEPGVMHLHLDDAWQPPYVALIPRAAEASSVNLAEIRIYTDSVSSFRLP
jgi:hypothetical protein